MLLTYAQGNKGAMCCSITGEVVSVPCLNTAHLKQIALLCLPLFETVAVCNNDMANWSDNILEGTRGSDVPARDVFFFIVHMLTFFCEESRRRRMCSRVLRQGLFGVKRCGFRREAA